MMKRLELNKEYTYKEICEVLGWDSSQGGNTKKSHINEIEHCFEFYHPINNKTKKPKKSYIFTQFNNIEYHNNHGGARAGAGRTFNLEDEFLTALSYYVKTGYDKNLYFENGHCNEIYFNNDSICKFFGIYDAIYGLDENLIKSFDTDKFEEVCTMLRGRMKSIIFNKMEKIEGITFSKGIVVDVGKIKKCLERHDEYLSSYDKYEEMYLQENHFMHTGQVAKAERWEEMINYIVGKFKEELGDDMNFKDIKRYNKITFDTSGKLFESNISKNEYLIAVQKINEYVVESITKSCQKKVQKLNDDIQELNEFFDGSDIECTSMKQYQKIIDVCIRGNNNEKV